MDELAGEALTARPVRDERRAVVAGRHDDRFGADPAARRHELPAVSVPVDPFDARAGPHLDGMRIRVGA